MLPIEGGETGLRHFGSYMAHPEDRCIYLLIRKLIDREPAIKRLSDDIELLKTALTNLVADVVAAHDVAYSLDQSQKLLQRFKP